MFIKHMVQNQQPFRGKVTILTLLLYIHVHPTQFYLCVLVNAAPGRLPPRFVIFVY